PPTLAAFAVSLSDAESVISPEFKKAGSAVIALEPDYDERDLPTPESMLRIFADIKKLNEAGKVLACSFVSNGGLESEIFLMCLGNNLGFEFSGSETVDKGRGTFILEVSDNAVNGKVIGHVITEPVINNVKLAEAEKIYNSTLSEIFPTSTKESSEIPSVPVNKKTRVFYSHKPTAEPRFIIPVFTGTNCEYETARAILNAGGKPEIFVVRSLTPELMKESTQRFAQALRDSQALVIPGGFSNGDEPDGSGKFIAIFL
ncbi:MAG: phosphoribosylformylglycinamidine synthase subunit PurQ, partial [Synergistaceae bacterium]|nr:phosphoribosylformylglycinamidine synthase subunit PurQ [Synergistaceae bacterium]